MSKTDLYVRLTMTQNQNFSLSPIVRLGMEDRIFMVAEDHFSLMRGSVCLSPCSQSSSIRAGLSPGNSYPGLGRKATPSVGDEMKNKKKDISVGKIDIYS